MLCKVETLFKSIKMLTCELRRKERKKETSVANQFVKWKGQNLKKDKKKKKNWCPTN